MTNIFSTRDPAGAAAGQLFLGTAIIGNILADCHASGVEGVRRGRERRASQQYADELNQARGRADELGRVAIRAVRHVASLEAEVARLRAALEQRQSYIDRLNARAKTGA